MFIDQQIEVGCSQFDIICGLIEVVGGKDAIPSIDILIGLPAPIDGHQLHESIGWNVGAGHGIKIGLRVNYRHDELRTQTKSLCLPFHFRDVRSRPYHGVVGDHLDGNRKLVARHTVLAHNGLRFPLQPGEDFTIEIAVQCLFCNRLASAIGDLTG